MRTAKKIIIYVACGLLVAAAAVFATLAYLWDKDTVTNTFTVGNVDITLDEAKVDEYGKPVGDLDGNGIPDRVQENTYRLIPGHTYTKDPTVTVSEGSENAFVRMLVTINCIDKLEAAIGGNFSPENYVKGWDNTVWKCVKVTDNGDNTKTYEFRYYSTTAPSLDQNDKMKGIQLQPLFESFTPPGEFDGSDLETLKDLKIEVVAHAIQAAGFASADDAWVEFEKQLEAGNVNS